jgi:hypothetical protein
MSLGGGKVPGSGWRSGGWWSDEPTAVDRRVGVDSHAEHVNSDVMMEPAEADQVFGMVGPTV